MKKYSALFLILSHIFVFSLPVSAATIAEAKITGINYLEGGRAEVFVEGAEGETSFIVSSATLIEAPLPVKKVKKGLRIFRPSSGKRSGGGGRRGFRSPFGGISKSMRKSMGLPDIALGPDVPSARPADIPEIPKIPKAPKGKTSPSVIDPEAVPTEEEEELYGRMESEKGVISKKGKAAKIVRTPVEPAEAVPGILTQRVINVKSTKEGVLLELESSNGQKEEMTLAEDKEVLQALSVDDLRENMTIHLEATEASEGLLAQKITIRE
jgi:hypothetical protein